METVLQELKGKRESILVDVRGTRQFEKFRIPGSINIPLFALKTKTFLKSRPLVLINEGHSYTQLTEECTTLLASGFTISILNGGLYHWRRKGGPLEGDVFAQRELNRISPQAFLAGTNCENWIVVDVSKFPLTLSLSSKSIHIPFANDSKEFIPKLKHVIRNDGRKDWVSVIIYDEKGTGYEEIEKHLQAEGIINVLYLEGGFEGYKNFKQQQASMQQEHSSGRRSVKTSKSCTGCP